jgi:hypothetical protein
MKMKADNMHPITAPRRHCSRLYRRNKKTMPKLNQATPAPFPGAMAGLTIAAAVPWVATAMLIGTAVEPSRVTLLGVTEQLDLAGAPLQLREMERLNPSSGVSVAE